MSNTENISVITLGEDGDQWMVTGTSDAHSADEAVRNWFEDQTGETLEASFLADDLIELNIEYRTDWCWLQGGTEPHGEEDRLVIGSAWGKCFAGFVVQA